MIEIEIDGKKFQVEPGKMIIEVADQADIRIPRFCYHKKLSVAANCRMCLVDVEKSGKPLPACATPVTDGMIVRTQSAKALDAQKGVMEFLLLNHPLDCPICDQGGECELQDVAMGYGKDISRYHEGKRSVKDKSLGSLVATEMTRCIHCTRCVRFGDEVAGLQELGTMGRGEATEIGTYVEKSLTSELSGNIIDLCPVGALTSKPYRFHARPWELEQHPSIAPHDCIGSNISIHTLREKVMRVAPRENEAINETWISDRDRFSYEGINHDQRLLMPMVKQDGQWQVVDWPVALEAVASGLKQIIAKQGAKQIGALLSPSSTVEEAYLLQKILRELGSNNIDHRLQQTDFAAQHTIAAFPGLHINLEMLEQQQTIVLVGSHITREQPIAAHRVRKATLQGAAVHVINPVDYPFHFEMVGKQIVKPSAMPQVLAEVIKALLDVGVTAPVDGLMKLVANSQPSDAAKALAAQLQKDGQKLIVLGAIAQNHPYASTIQYLADILARMTHAHVGLLTPGANAAGAWLVGAVPHRGVAMKHIEEPGLNTYAMLQAKLAAYILFNVEPGLDCADPVLANAAMEQAELVVAITPFFCEKVASYADVLLPSVPFAETSGTFVNTEGKWQRFKGAAPAQGEARPGWKVLRVLGNVLQLNHFDYQSSEDIFNAAQKATADVTNQQRNELHLPATIPTAIEGIERISAWPIYRADTLVRRAPALQAIVINDDPAVYLPIDLANQLQVSADSWVQVSAGDSQAILPVILVDNMPANTVYIPRGFPETAALSGAFGAVTIMRSEQP
jgi:NADH-quinone oxidoreductase subunit G